MPGQMPAPVGSMSESQEVSRVHGLAEELAPQTQWYGCMAEDNGVAPIRRRWINTVHATARSKVK